MKLDAYEKYCIQAEREDKASAHEDEKTEYARRHQEAAYVCGMVANGVPLQEVANLVGMRLVPMIELLSDKAMQPLDNNLFIDEMYRLIANADNTEQRIKIFEISGYPCPSMDNYNGDYGQDPDFENGYHKWVHLYSLTRGVERAAVISVAVELFKNSDIHLRHGCNFFSHAFNDDTRDAHYAKAMCLLYSNTEI